MHIDGHTAFIAHIGYPTDSFQSPMIYNPYFQSVGLNAVVLPMACRIEAYPSFLRSVFALENILGALITMPHKVTTVSLLDEVTPSVRVSGACNAVKRTPDGRLTGEMFDGEGFARSLARKGCALKGAKALVVGCGGIGSAIAASLAQREVAELHLVDLNSAAADGVRNRLQGHFPGMKIEAGHNDPAGFDLVVNATPLGSKGVDSYPMDVTRIEPSAVVADVVMRGEATEFLQVASQRGCTTLDGFAMLFEQIPLYLEYFGLPVASPDRLRQLAMLHV